MPFETAYYIASYKQTAFNACYKTGLFPSLLLVMAITESDSGNKELARVHNNHFGIHANAKWFGRTVEQKNDGGELTSFRVYNDPKQGFFHFVEALKQDKDILNARVFHAKKIETQLAKIAEGLGEDEDWVNNILALVEQHELSKVDEEAQELWKIWKKSEKAA